MSALGEQERRPHKRRRTQTMPVIVLSPALLAAEALVVEFNANAHMLNRASAANPTEFVLDRRKSSRIGGTLMHPTSTRTSTAMKIIPLLLVLALGAVLLSSCGEDSCDELAAICEACIDPVAKSTCEAHVRQGDENMCEFDVANRVFEQACVPSGLNEAAVASQRRISWGALMVPARQWTFDEAVSQRRILNGGELVAERKFGLQ